jgi:hypothetical protein
LKVFREGRLGIDWRFSDFLQAFACTLGLPARAEGARGGDPRRLDMASWLEVEAGVGVTSR